jgi:site-specific recombinase XerD
VSAIVPIQSRVVATPRATSAETDEQLLQSWLGSLNSAHTRRNFEAVARRFLSGLPQGLRHATVEDVRANLDAMTKGLARSSAEQYVLRAKSLMAYSHQLGYTPFNAGTVIKVRNETNRGAKLAKRIISETEVALLIRFTPGARDKVLIQTLYAAGLRVSEIVSLSWGDCIEREGGLLQLSGTGKGGKTRNVLLPQVVSIALRQLRLDVALSDDPVFVTRLGTRMTPRNVHGLIKTAARRAGVTVALSPHWLRHAHGSHALDNGATLAEVQETLGHGNISTTSGYLHARPNSSSGLKLDPGVFGNE